MALQIEILSADRDVAVCAFYYPVPVGSRLAAAADAGRTAAGKRLSAQELQDLKDGALFEVVIPLSVRGMTAAQARSRLQNSWTEHQSSALAAYTEKYRFLNLAWDGSTWS